MRGFTVLELMVALALASIGSIAIFEIMRGQLQAHYDQSRVGDAQANGRVAIDAMVQRFEMTGFGLPGSVAFSLSSPAGNELDNAAGGDVYQTCPGTDVVEIRSRDPRQTWIPTLGATSSTLQLSPIVGTDVPWVLGQRLEVFLAMGQVATTQTKAVRAANVLSVALNSAQDSSNYPASLDSYLTTSQVFMMSVSRFRVSCVDTAHPTLVLEDDTDINGDGTIDQNDALPIANDIEDLQVAYFVDADQNNVIDATELQTPYAATAGHTYPAVADWTTVKAMRITVVARSENQGQAGASMTFSPLTVENHTPLVTTDYYVRRPMSEMIYFVNRNTSNNTYEHISNQWL